MTADEVAELLAVPVSWMRESTRSGAKPCVELGRTAVTFEKTFDELAVAANRDERPWLEQARVVFLVVYGLGLRRSRASVEVGATYPPLSSGRR